MYLPGHCLRHVDDITNKLVQQPKEGQVREEKELPIVSCTAWGYWAESIQEPQAIIEDCKDWKIGVKAVGLQKWGEVVGPSSLQRYYTGSNRPNRAYKTHVHKLWKFNYLKSTQHLPKLMLLQEDYM